MPSGYAATGLSILGLLLATGCDQTFEPLQESDRHFSIYGFLDPAADTQWVRVMPVRGSIFTSPEPVDATVVLEHLDSGRKLVMNDSLFSYRAVNLGGADLHAYNFSTVEKVVPGATYRLTVTRSDGVSSTATVAVPPEFPTVVVRISLTTRANRDLLRIEGAEHLAMVHVLHHQPSHPLGPIVPVYQRLETASSPAQGIQIVGLDRRLDPNQPGGPPLCVQSARCEIFIVASGSKWPFSPLATGGTISHMDVASNVAGGVGFVGGIITKTIPYENCSRVGVTSQDQYCDLIYNAATATITGFVADEQHAPLTDNPVVLREVEGDKVRTAWTDATGFYSISGLDPGVVYQMCVKRQQFYDYDETFVLDPGERLTVNVVLTRAFRLDGC